MAPQSTDSADITGGELALLDFEIGVIWQYHVEIVDEAYLAPSDQALYTVLVKDGVRRLYVFGGSFNAL